MAPVRKNDGTVRSEKGLGRSSAAPPSGEVVQEPDHVVFQRHKLVFGPRRDVGWCGGGSDNQVRSRRNRISRYQRRKISSPQVWLYFKDPFAASVAVLSKYIRHHTPRRISTVKRVSGFLRLSGLAYLFPCWSWPLYVLSHSLPILRLSSFPSGSSLPAPAPYIPLPLHCLLLSHGRLLSFLFNVISSLSLFASLSTHQFSLFAFRRFVFVPSHRFSLHLSFLPLSSVCGSMSISFSLLPFPSCVATFDMVTPSQLAVPNRFLLFALSVFLSSSLTLSCCHAACNLASCHLRVGFLSCCSASPFLPM